MTQPAPQWSVQSITPFTQFIAGMGPQEGLNVNFTTTAGVTGTVFIENARIQDKNYVAQAIQSRVDALHAILNLVPNAGR